MELQTKEERELKCVLTDKEILTYSKGNAKRQQDKIQAELEKKAAASYHKEKIERLESEINTVSRNIANGYEFRMVKCQWEFSWGEGVKRLYRQDTGERVDTQAITAYERQSQLKIIPGEEPESENQEEPPLPEATKPTRRRPQPRA